MTLPGKQTPLIPSTGKRPRRRFGRILAAALALLLVLGAAYEAVSEAADTHRYPAPGSLVDMGGYSLHLYCTGQGSPTVLLEAGLGGGVATWPFVQPVVAKSTRVCSYDRSGWAWSGGQSPQSGHETVTRLHTLLDKAGEKGPYILVGHSLGGLYNQLFAATFPHDVAGMVLVEARHQEFALRLPPAAQGAGPLLTRVALTAAFRLGVVRLVRHLVAIPGIPGNLPPGMVEMAIRPSSEASASSEERLLPAVEDEVRSSPVSLGNKPLVVVTRDPALNVGAMLATWMETQRLFLSLSTNSRLVEAKGSGHMVPYDNPGVVTEAIAEVLNATRP